MAQTTAFNIKTHLKAIKYIDVHVAYHETCRVLTLRWSRGLWYAPAEAQGQNFAHLYVSHGADNFYYEVRASGWAVDLAGELWPRQRQSWFHGDPGSGGLSTKSNRRPATGLSTGSRF